MDEQVSTAGGRRAAKARLVAGMVRGLPWREAAEAAGLPTGRTTAYRLRRDARLRGDAALDEGRHGHASKLREPVRRWLEAYCRGAPSASGSMAQAALRDRFGLDVSVRHINRVRATLGVSWIYPQAGAGGAGGDRTSLAPPTSQPAWRDGAGGLLLLAAVHETGLLPALDTAVLRADGPVAPSHATGTRALLLTLLFLNAVGLRRTWDLRGYAGDGLALLTGRGRAYGYRHAEHVLSDLARAGSADPLTDALATWTTTLWRPRPSPTSVDTPPPIFYIDGHRKPVYSDRLIPRGLVARRGPCSAAARSRSCTTPTGTPCSPRPTAATRT